MISLKPKLSTSSRKSSVVVSCDARQRLNNVKNLTKEVMQQRLANGNKVFDAFKVALQEEVELRQKVLTGLSTFVREECAVAEKQIKEKFQSKPENSKPNVTVEIVDEDDI